MLLHHDLVASGADLQAARQWGARQGEVSWVRRWKAPAEAGSGVARALPHQLLHQPARRWWTMGSSWRDLDGCTDRVGLRLAARLPADGDLGDQLIEPALSRGEPQDPGMQASCKPVNLA